jgi:nucleoid-associated protein YgaU
MGQDEKRDERKFEQAEKATKTVNPAKLGREAKIGAMVILTLLLGLGIAIGVRFMHKKTDLVGKQDAETSTPPTPPKKDLLFGNDDFKSKPTAGNASAAPKWKHPDNNPEPKRLGDLSGLPAPMPPQPPVARELETPKSPGRHDPFASDPSPAHNGSTMTPDRDQNVLRRASADAGMTSSREAPRYNHYGDSVAEADSLPRSSYATASSHNMPPAPPATISSYDNSRYGNNSEQSRPAYGSGSTYGGGSAYESNVVSRPFYGNPPRREEGKYEVQPNDSYTAISQKVYGTDAYFKALVEYNRSKGKGDEQLKPGAMVFTPPTYELQQAYPDLCPKAGRHDPMQNQTSLASTHGSYRSSGRTYTVTEGDTLFTIARYELGKASRWAEIYDLNRDLLGKDYNYLRPGTRLALPEGERADSVARQPGDGYQR